MLSARNAALIARGSSAFGARPRRRGSSMRAGVAARSTMGGKATAPTGLHALRALFVTEALARGENEAWVSDRTGHKSSQMIATYNRRARSFKQANMPHLGPLDVLLGLASERDPRGKERDPGNARRRHAIRKGHKTPRNRAPRVVATRLGIDPKYPNDGETHLYGPDGDE
jgi:hypothetical protein